MRSCRKATEAPRCGKWGKKRAAVLIERHFKATLIMDREPIVASPP
jgi:hypothetical protein